MAKHYPQYCVDSTLTPWGVTPFGGGVWIQDTERRFLGYCRLQGKALLVFSGASLGCLIRSGSGEARLVILSSLSAGLDVSLAVVHCVFWCLSFVTSINFFWLCTVIGPERLPFAH